MLVYRTKAKPSLKSLVSARFLCLQWRGDTYVAIHERFGDGVTAEVVRDVDLVIEVKKRSRRGFAVRTGLTYLKAVLREVIRL